ncbi:non-functional pseudokinase ZED1-like [Macadamia integrifolia]|uniref:non-functional pseudokinase ZED1-like n=1 Tax=Macadamia integrifolia TaxID=60698 RepID=UPI001C528FD7|nr:non-functional pseudokinase ZED1-like [Macadamia integrifolia]
MRCFRIPRNKGTHAQEEEEEEKKSITEFRFAKGRSEKDDFMIRNGGLILEGRITSCGVNFTPFRTFSKRQLQIATENYARNRIVHIDRCEFYKGNLDDREVIVKNWQFNMSSRSMECSITEVVVGLQMNNHKNVLKLLGCCLETPAPNLVFEFPENGCLSHHIYNEGLLSWESRLRIAIEVADAISYLHTGTSNPIIHRNIHAKTIFLDKHFVAKLSEFWTSVSIPLGETYVVVDCVMGTTGNLEPLYSQTGHCTEKIDVYSFALLLLEILSGKRVSSFFSDFVNETSDDDDDDSSSSVNGSPDLIGHNPDTVEQLVESSYFKSTDRIWRWLKAKMLREGNKEQIMAYAELAQRCMAKNREERPTMVEVAYELRRIKGIIINSTSLS